MRLLHLCIVGLAVWCSLGPVSGCGKPNILFILADDLGVGDTSIEGYTVSSPPNKIVTPNLERMAKAGITFTQAYTPAPVCGPSRYSILSGRHTGHSPIRGNTGIGRDYGIPCSSSSENILSNILKKNGYHNAVIGKWGFNNHPFECGFDKFYGQKTHVDAHSYFPLTMHDNTIENGDQSDNVNLPKNDKASDTFCTKSLENCDFTHDLFTAEAVSYIRSRAGQPNPFFLYLSYSTPHVGSWKPLEKLEKHREKLHKVAPLYTCPDDIVVASDVHRLEECMHKSAVENYLDRDIGVLLDLLDELSITESTLVVFAADNGPDFSLEYSGLTVHADTFLSSGNRRGGKREIFEAGILTPFVFQWKGKIPANVRSSKLTSLTDLFATFIAVSQSTSFVNYPDLVDSLSMVPIMTGSNCNKLSCCVNHQGPTEHDYLFWDYCVNQVKNWEGVQKTPKAHCSQAVHSKDGWKFIWNHKEQEHLLYDMKTAFESGNYQQLEKSKVTNNPAKFNELKSVMEDNNLPLAALGFDGEADILDIPATPYPTTAQPTQDPTRRPTLKPTTGVPTPHPTQYPTAFPTTKAPTPEPTPGPTKKPTFKPTNNPTMKPVTGRPTPQPTTKPTNFPTTLMPTSVPTRGPTPKPVTSSPTTSSPTVQDPNLYQCEESSRMRVEFKVETSDACLSSCDKERNCKFYSFSADCECCALYRACNSPFRFDESWFYDDWRTTTRGTMLTWSPTNSPTVSPTSRPTNSPVPTPQKVNVQDFNITEDGDLQASGGLNPASIVGPLVLLIVGAAVLVVAKRRQNSVESSFFGGDDKSSTDGSTDASSLGST